METVWRWVKPFVEIFMTVCIISLLVALATSIPFFRSLQGFHLFFEKLMQIANGFLHMDTLIVQIGEARTESFLSIISEYYPYSLMILFSAFCVSFFTAASLSYIYFILPKKIKKWVSSLLFFIQSIPDVVFIFAIQLSIIWIFKQTGWLIIDPIAGMDKVYVLPILTLSILPSIFLFQTMVLAVSEEYEKPYVELARAKGLSKHHIWFHHLFRNVVIHVVSNMQYYFWFMLSNLLVLEFLFNMRGFMAFLRMQLHQADIVAISLTFLFLPFYLIDWLSKRVVFIMTGEKDVSG
jgi:peptide/nickel transport system permease protein